MFSTNNILDRVNEIRHLISINKMEMALKRLMDFIVDFDEDSQDDVILISMDFHDWKEELENGTLETLELKRFKRRLASRMLDTLRFATQKAA